MNKLLYIIIILFTLPTVKAQIINFPDANLKARLLAAEAGNGIAYQNGLSIKIDSNNDNEIQVSEALLVTNLVLNNCNISNLSGLENFINLTRFNCGNNSITSLDLTPFTNLVGFDAYNNNLTSLNVSNLSQLTNFSCNNNQLTSLVVSNLNSLHTIICFQNQLTNLDLSDIPTLYQLNCSNNFLQNLDLANQEQLSILNCSNNNLVTLNIKNGSNESMFHLNFSNNPTLEYVCADDFQLTQINDKVNQYGYVSCFVNSYCSYISGGNIYTINGLVRYDEATNGCDDADIVYPNLKLLITDGTNSGGTFGSMTGNYNYSLQEGTHTIQPVLDNPTYFNVYPNSVSITFPNQISPYSQNFCITPNGSHPDLDITLMQIDNGYSAVPGYQNTYKIIYKNKGTNTQSGTINLVFNDAIMNYNYAIPNIVSQSENLLVWNFSDLKPFESREIDFALFFNAPTDLPPINVGDLLSFTASINSSSIDDTPNDNTFVLNQVASDIFLLNSPTYTSTGYFNLYPNPAAEVLNIQSEEYIKKESIKVYNTAGQLIKYLLNAEAISSIDISNFVPGIYFISIQTEKGTYKSKFIKK